jgi:exonuclease SbcC
VRFDRIQLESFKCYSDVDLQLNPGVTVIHGANGSGKSTLLEACFFALYGSAAVSTTLDEVVTIGEEEMAVELWFTHAGESFHITREVRHRGENARTTTCVLETPTEPVEGAMDVRAAVTEMLRMDAEAFVNCAYVRQGEVNKLIDASPADRQDMLDDLLQLGQLEEYRERASNARVGVKRVLDDKQGALGELDEQIERKEEKNLHERRNNCRSALAEVTSDREDYEQNRERARETLDRAEEILGEHEHTQERLSALQSEIDDIRTHIRETEREREDLADRIDECRGTLGETREHRDTLLEAVDLESEPRDSTDNAGPVDEALCEVVATTLEAVRGEIKKLTEQIRELSVEKQEHDGDSERLRERADRLDAEAGKRREEADRLESEVTEAREQLAEKRAELAAMAETIAAKREAFEGAPVAFGEAAAHRETLAAELSNLREQRGELEADLENARERVAEAERLREEGRCPECGQPVEGSPHVEALAERRERVEAFETQLEDIDGQIEQLTANIETAEQLVEREGTVEELERERENLAGLLDERADNVEERAERVETLRREADERETAAEEKREAAAAAETQAETCREAIAEHNREKDRLVGRRDTLETLVETLDDITDLVERRERLRDQRAERGERNDERRERLAEKRDRRDELRESVDEQRVEQARGKRDDAQEYLEKVETKLADLAEQRDELQARLGAVENELDELDRLRERREELAGTVERLESLYGETERLESLYGDLRADLRAQNVETLERMLNETFDLVYQNDTYARLDLDDDYRLSVVQKDGAQLDPQQLSGGERALFNLSLRCAIYRLLAEGIEGTAPMPPLILDEPTVFLDSGHVSQLLELIAAMYDLGVDQILVVSHDDALIGAADDLVTVRTDSTTNRSTVERGREERALAADD